MILNATTKSLEIVLGSTVTANQATYSVDYTDINQTSFKTEAFDSTDGQTNNTTAVTAVSAPGSGTSRLIKNITIYNADSDTIEVQVNINNNSTLREQITINVPSENTLMYVEGRGWFITDAQNVSASTISFTPDGDIASTDVQSAIVEVRDDTDTKLTGKADLTGGNTFTGVQESINASSRNVITEYVGGTDGHLTHYLLLDTTSTNIRFSLTVRGTSQVSTGRGDVQIDIAGTLTGSRKSVALNAVESLWVNPGTIRVVTCDYNSSTWYAIEIPESGGDGNARRWYVEGASWTDLDLQIVNSGVTNVTAITQTEDSRTQSNASEHWFEGLIEANSGISFDGGTTVLDNSNLVLEDKANTFSEIQHINNITDTKGDGAISIGDGDFPYWVFRQNSLRRLVLESYASGVYGDVMIINRGGRFVEFPSGITFDGGINVLSDYEKGAWSPTLTADGTDFDSVSYDSIRGAKYIRIGNWVHCQGTMRTSSVTKGSASGNIRISNLPFTVSSNTSGQNGVSVMFISEASSWSGDVPLGGVVLSSQSHVRLTSRSSVNGGTANLAVADVSTGSFANFIRFSFSYII